jgi:predicted TIM-barrel fold metal-dependent hydrolase
VITLGTGRTTVLQGIVHLVICAVFCSSPWCREAGLTNLGPPDILPCRPGSRGAHAAAGAWDIRGTRTRTERQEHGMLIVDAQIHLWKNSKPNPNHRQVPDYTADDALKEMGEGGVEAAVIHPPGWDPNANAIAVDAARRHPTRFAILGNFPLDRPESRSLIDGWKSQPGMLGLRFALLQPHQQTWLSDGTMDWLWPAAERAGLPVALLGPNLLQVVGRIAERHRGLKLIIDHFGRPDAEWSNLADLVATAKHPNVALKATGAPSYSHEPYPHRDIQGHIRKLYDAFGPERMFWGTDITRMPIAWRQCVTMFTEELPWLSAKDKELIMGRALCAWLAWNLPG